MRYERLFPLATWCASLAGLIGSTMLPAAQAAALSASSQKLIRAATFEVVQSRPKATQAVYEKALPLDLLPYQQRVDAYRSTGTAFAMGANRYVTAAHVLLLGVGSQFGLPALRDSTGRVYEIDRVLKYSQAEDFAVLSLK